jgi:predicted transcriptional regulator
MELTEKILREIDVQAGAGGRYSTSGLARQCGTGYRRMRSTLSGLKAMGFVEKTSEYHRPNVMANRWGLTDAGIRLLNDFRDAKPRGL